METIDNETILFDRINMIKDTNKKYDLENNAYISFSGGKDSVVLSYLVDLALPNNKIPRVFSNTGIEYKAIVDFVEREREKDNRIEIIYPKKNIKKMLEEVGYPFKSKEHSKALATYQRSGIGKSVNNYLGNGTYGKLIQCPKCLKYQFTDEFKIKVSEKCCNEMKKKPFAKWQKANKKSITMTGMQKSEGGQRMNINCVVFDKDKHIIKFHPLAPTNDEWEEWFIAKYNIKLCELYYEPYNFRRTGCKGCPYSLELQKQLDTMEKLLPNEKKQCELIWKPIYDEYRRIGYRLKKKDDEQMTIYDFLEEKRKSND